MFRRALHIPTFFYNWENSDWFPWCRTWYIVCQHVSNQKVKLNLFVDHFPWNIVLKWPCQFLLFSTLQKKNQNLHSEKEFPFPYGKNLCIFTKCIQKNWHFSIGKGSDLTCQAAYVFPHPEVGVICIRAALTLSKKKSTINSLKASCCQQLFSGSCQGHLARPK